MIDPNLDHVGIVVPDLELAMEALSAHLGVAWLGLFEPKVTMHDTVHGTHLVELRTASTTHYPRLEFIESIPDSPWALDRDGMILHHLAYYAGELPADSSRVAVPCPIEIAGIGPDGQIPRIFTYHVHNGLRFELLERRTAEVPGRLSQESA
jgi:hypothetical protein